jgi:acyl-coenzyme A thioesterase PaaI-like protein
MATRAFQDDLPDIHCFGCGPDNPEGLRIKSYWSAEGESVCHFKPAPHHSAGPRHFVNGGIIATVMDCHAICTAMADGYKSSGQEIGQGEEIVFVTGSLNVIYLAPAPIDATLAFRATISKKSDKKTVLACTVDDAGHLVAKGEVAAIRVPPAWGKRR